MPAFFFISGFLFDTKKLDTPNFRNFIFKKILNLIIPYASFLVLIILISLSFHVGSMNIKDKDFVIKALWGGELLVGQFGAFWFITTLLFTIFGYSIIYKLIKSETNRLLLIASFFLLGHFESILIHTYGYTILLPGNIDVCLITLSYFYVGIKIQKQLYNPQSYLSKFHNGKYFISALVVLTISIALISHQYKMDLKYKHYLNPLFTLFVPIIFTSVILFFSRLLLKFKIFSIFEILGKHSLVIMFLHLIVKDFLFKYNVYNIWLFSILGCILPFLLSSVFNNYKLTRLIFSGSATEFKKLGEPDV